ncbi:NLI interacting factor [Venturia nashicola]|uniref:Mitochondrial import inner membrane translocase subunit TIM50 n=1 Tax=Venturia nashicola TaxID=86259 RepID=A0A4Z1NSM1_9PEZI|nr:NLI interacting factor [Venturia nashicola]TLD23703.1 NLI interacting factor [Venturia nashicola]
MIISRLLPRAVSTLNARPLLAPALVPAAAAQWARYKSNRSSDPLTPGNSTYNPNKPSPSSSSSSSSSPSASDSAKQASSAKEAGEFDTTATPSRNTTPSSQPGPGRTEPGSLPIDRNQENGFDTAQEEFNSPQSPGANTAPNAPSQPLPDLRQGIPSTFAEEFVKNQKASQAGEHVHHDINVTENARQSSGDGDGDGGKDTGRGEGEFPKSAYQTSIDKRRDKMAKYLYGGVGLLLLTSALYVGRNWDDEIEERRHPNAPSGWGLQLFYDRAKARISGQMGYYTEPTFDKLLPDITPAPPYTLVLSLEDMLIHSEWTREHGWRTAKRPGLDYFLGYMSQYFEIVLFTSQPVGAADQIVRKMDPWHFIVFPLFREATRYENGHYVKDLAYLNRPLSKTIIIDTKPEHVKAQPENAIVVKPWKGDVKDKELVNLIPFLEHVAAMGINDVRDAIKSFEGKHIPTEFAMRQAKAREEFNKQLAEEQAKKPKRSGVGFLNSALGIKPQGGTTYDGQTTVAEELAKGKMLGDQIRERGIKQYEILEREIRENGEKWLKEEAEMEKKAMAEQMQNMKKSFPFFGGGPKPGEVESNQ